MARAAKPIQSGNPRIANELTKLLLAPVKEGKTKPPYRAFIKAKPFRQKPEAPKTN